VVAVFINADLYSTDMCTQLISATHVCNTVPGFWLKLNYSYLKDDKAAIMVYILLYTVTMFNWAMAQNVIIQM
jgi:hypothetical protein